MLSYLIVLVLSTLIYEWWLGKICAIWTLFDSTKSFHTMRNIKRVKIKTVGIEVHSIEVLSNDMYDQWLNSLFFINLCRDQSVHVSKLLHIVQNWLIRQYCELRISILKTMFDFILKMRLTLHFHKCLSKIICPAPSRTHRLTDTVKAKQLVPYK